MEFLVKEHIEILDLLVKAKVDFILIGGYSVIFYGYSRGTNDLDLWVKPDNANKKKLLHALRNYGINEGDLKKLEMVDFNLTNMFFIGEAPFKVDFLTHVIGVNWDDAIIKVNFLPVRNLNIPVVNYYDLITMKMLSDRLKDKADVEELQRINQFRKNP